MAFTQGLTTTFKEELLLGGHDFDTGGGASVGTYNIALYNTSATLGLTDDSYDNSDTANEVSTSGDYTAGGPSAGQELTISTAPGNGGSGTTVFTSFSNKTFTAVSFTAGGALIYNSSPSGSASSRTNPSVCVLDFGGAKTASGGDFTIQFPAAAAGTAIIRIA